MGIAQPLYIGTAGWAVPAVTRDAFPSEGTTLARYAARFRAAEINSTFHRSHRPATFERWAATVPEPFRFAVKLPKAITHSARLVECDALLTRFAEEIAPLAARRGPTLVQLPPSLAFERDVAARFFDSLVAQVGGSIACEPRHPSWFGAGADALLAARGVARAAADPAVTPEAAQPGGWPGLAYFRFHGSPRVYWSAYEPERLGAFAREVAAARRRGATCWAIFDNTAGGAAAGNALAFAAMLADIG